MYSWPYVVSSVWVANTAATLDADTATIWRGTSKTANWKGKGMHKTFHFMTGTNGLC